MIIIIHMRNRGSAVTVFAVSEEDAQAHPNKVIMNVPCYKSTFGVHNIPCAMGWACLEMLKRYHDKSPAHTHTRQSAPKGFFSFP